jgi:hypothetical protein
MDKDTSMTPLLASRWARRLLLAGLIVIILGALDPLEGSIVILAAIALVTFMARRLDSRHARVLYVALVCAVVGIGALWGLSAVGGFGGTSGRSSLWALALVPYPVGWVMSIVGASKAWRDAR